MCSLFTIFLAFSPSLPGASGDVQSHEEPIIVSQTRRFHLPIIVAEGTRGKLKEFRLLAPTKKKNSWRTSPKAPADAKDLPFEAPKEGDYWFCVQTVDRDGKTNPDKAVCDLKI